MSTFSAINTAYTALSAYQKALDVTGQNISNVSTPGYRRADAVLSESAVSTPNGTLLDGVTVTGINRANTAFIDVQLGMASSESGRWSAAKNQLTAIQSVLSPGSGADLGSLLDTFWNSWQSLAASPDQLAPRQTVQQAAASLVTGLNGTSQQLTTLQGSMDQSINDTVQQVNDLAKQLADVNGQIAALQDNNGSAAPLETTRQNLMDQLSQLTGAIAVAPDAAGGPIVTIGRQPLVQGSEAFQLEVGKDANGQTQVTWASSGAPADAQGELGGLLQVRDQQLPQYMETLNQIAGAVITSVNSLHQTGIGMNGEVGDFFTGTGAADIALSAAVAANPSAIAAGAADFRAIAASPPRSPPAKLRPGGRTDHP